HAKGCLSGALLRARTLGNSGLASPLHSIGTATLAAKETHDNTIAGSAADRANSFSHNASICPVPSARRQSGNHFICNISGQRQWARPSDETRPFAGL